MSTAEQWQHLAAWWAIHGHRYNLSDLARTVGKDKSALSTLLRNPATSPYAASAELLAKLAAELQLHYAPISASPTR